MNSITEDILMHYGMPRRSGRYPWGSGDSPYQRNGDFLSRVEALEKEGWTETPENIKKIFGLTTTEYRIEKSICLSERRQLRVDRAKALKKDGLNNNEIAREMGLPNESSVRSLLDSKSEDRMLQAKNTANHIKSLVDSKGMIDVGNGAEHELNISKEKLNAALYLLKREGYEVYSGGVPNATNAGKQINQKVICPPGTKHSEIYNFDKIHPLNEDNYISHDGGETFDKYVYPKSFDSKRLKIRYADDVGPDGATGNDKDGIVEIRRGVKDVSLGNDHYSQVRILVDGTHYIKGMAVYSDNMPDGADIVFNTNKNSSVGKMDVLKEIKKDPDNPFGSLIKAGGQSYYIDDDGNRQLSCINKTRSEGDWTEWKDALPSQFLSKQSLSMAKKQLNLAKADKLAEYDEICSNVNPTVKKHLLQKFSDECDSAAVHLQAAALPGQKYHVIIPINTLKDNEVYAPQYKNGQELALIRYPHGGTFEIPVLKVNNKHDPAKKIIGTDSIDAIGINKKIADQLSGADFDGDTVMCIPTNDKAGKVKISHRTPLKDLEGFDPKIAYGPDSYAGRKVKIMTEGAKGKEMGVISNLITDMTLKGATEDELARAVKHSMVVIDATKHKLDYKRSEQENGIASLKKIYQENVDENGVVRYGGASTIISRAKGETSVNKRQGNPKVNIKGTKHYDPTKPEGALIYKDADDLYYPIQKRNKDTGMITVSTTTKGKKITYDPNDPDQRDKYEPIQRVDKKTGKVRYTNKAGDIEYAYDTRKQQSTRMAETDDPYTLVSKDRYQMELVYADHASYMKNLANTARKEMVTTKKIPYSAAAKKTYQKEVESLNEKLNEALKNAPRERAAHRMTQIAVNEKLKANPNMSKSDIKKAKQQSITSSRAAVGAKSRKDRNILITDREWEAIQAGAVSETTLTKILNNTDMSAIRERATPKTSSNLSSAKINQIKAMQNSNYTIGEIADRMNLSPSTVSKYLK